MIRVYRVTDLQSPEEDSAVQLQNRSVTLRVSRILVAMLRFVASRDCVTFDGSLFSKSMAQTREMQFYFQHILIMGTFLAKVTSFFLELIPSFWFKEEKTSIFFVEAFEKHSFVEEFCRDALSGEM